MANLESADNKINKGLDLRVVEFPRLGRSVSTTSNKLGLTIFLNKHNDNINPRYSATWDKQPVVNKFLVLKCNLLFVLSNIGFALKVSN